MSDMHVSTEIQRRLEKSENYNRWIYESIRPYLGNRLLEVGCSIGNLTRFLLGRQLLVGIDIWPEYIRIVREKYGANDNAKFLVLDISKPESARLADYKLDTIVCLNVLEHIADDRLALENMERILTPGGRLALLVPAFPELYGAMDAADNHYRRYRRRELEGMVRDVGFSIVASRYFNFLGFFGWYFNSVVLKRAIIPKNQLRFYNAIVPLVSRLERAFAPPFGQSLILIGQKVRRLGS